MLLGDDQYAYLASLFRGRPSPMFSRLSYILGAAEDAMLEGMKKSLATHGFDTICNMFDGCVVLVNETGCSLHSLASSMRNAICMDVDISPFTSPGGFTKGGSVGCLLKMRGRGRPGGHTQLVCGKRHCLLNSLQFMVPRRDLRVLSAGLCAGPLTICDVAGELEQRGFSIAIASPWVLSQLGYELVGALVHQQQGAYGHFVGATSNPPGPYVHILDDALERGIVVDEKFVTQFLLGIPGLSFFSVCMCVPKLPSDGSWFSAAAAECSRNNGMPRWFDSRDPPPKSSRRSAVVSFGPHMVANESHGGLAVRLGGPSVFGQVSIGAGGPPNFSGGSKSVGRLVLDRRLGSVAELVEY